jgi:hypothetical protein
MPAVFDLTLNPFAVLGVSLRTRQEDIAEAGEDALSDHRYAEAVIQKAQQALMVPKGRLDAELSWLPGTSPSTAKTLLQHLGDALYDDAAAILSDMVGLDKANLAADLCCRDRTGTGYVMDLMEGYRDFDAKSVQAVLAENRAISGFARIDPDMLSGALVNLRKIHAKAAMEFIKAEKHPGKAMYEVVDFYLHEENDHINQAMTELAREYDAWSEGKLRDIRDGIQKEIEALRLDHSQVSRYERISDLLDAWDEYSQPMQMIEEAKGHDEPRSRELYNEIRDFCLWLANDESEYEHALRLSKDLQRVFPELPSVSINLEEDVQALERLVDQSKREKLIGPLAALIPEIYGKEDNLVHDLIMAGFGHGSQGVALQLYKAFIQSVELSQGSDQADVPWNVIRNLALNLNNDHDSPRAAHTLLEGAVKFTRIPPRPEILEVLKREMRVTRVNYLGEEFKASKDRDAMIAIAGEIIATTDDPDTRANFTRVRDALVSQKHKKLWKWGFAALVAGGIIWAIIADGNKRPSYSSSSSSSYSTPTYSETTPSTDSTTSNSDWLDSVPAGSWRKDIPPAIKGGTLSLAGLRYCMFEGEVIDALRLMVQDRDTNKFNAAVNDYNARCSDARYYERDMTTVKREMAANRTAVAQTASDTVQSWQGGIDTEASRTDPPINDYHDFNGATNIQTRLKALGYYTGIVDGDWGPGSMMALHAWKKDNNIPLSENWSRRIEKLLMGN